MAKPKPPSPFLPIDTIPLLHELIAEQRVIVHQQQAMLRALQAILKALGKERDRG